MNRGAKAGLWLLGAVVGLVFLGQMFSQYGGSSHSYPSQWTHPGALSQALTASKPTQLTDSLAVAVRPHAGTFDSVFVADITITNRGASAVGSVAIACEAVGENGGATGHVGATLHNVFAAHATATEPNVELRFIHRPASARCTIASATVLP